MKIINLVENTEGASGCACSHGLSFYVETAGGHKILMDAGPSGPLLLENAEKLGVDLKAVDTAFLSHGHYDHSDGLAAFRSVNPDAVIYAQRGADDAYCSLVEDMHYIGISDAVKEIRDITWLDGDCEIDGELSVFAGIGYTQPAPAGNRELGRKTEDGYVQDDFSHEMCLVIREGGRCVLMSGCAHHGILNIMDHFRGLYGRDPDAVISGFHMKKSGGYTDEDIFLMLDIAEALKKYGNTQYYTCHCTGTGPYRVMKEVMKDRLRYVHCGDTVFITD